MGFLGMPERWLRRGLALAESQLAVIALCLVAAAIAVAVVWWDSSDAVRNFALIVAGAAGFPLVIWRARVADRQAGTAETNLTDQRFDRGIEMLGSPLETIREAGELRIRKLGEEYPERYAEQAMALLRDRFREPERATGAVDDDDG